MINRIRSSIFFGLIVIVPVTAILGVFIAVIGPILSLIIGKWPSRGNLLWIGLRIRRLWSFILLRAYGVRVQCVGPGLQRSMAGRSYMIVSNHQSALDILVLCDALRTPFAFFAKSELKWIPLFGLGAWFSGTIFINRKRGISDERAIRTLENVLKKAGSICMFPEGTRSEDGVVLPFKRGAFVLAIQNQVPILPVAILDSRELLPKKSLGVRSGTIHVWVGEPIGTQGLNTNDRHALSESVRQIICDALLRHRLSTGSQEASRSQ